MRGPRLAAAFWLVAVAAAAARAPDCGRGGGPQLGCLRQALRDLGSCGRRLRPPRPLLIDTKVLNRTLATSHHKGNQGAPLWLLQVLAANLEVIDSALSIRHRTLHFSTQEWVEADLWGAAWCRFMHRLVAIADRLPGALVLARENETAVWRAVLDIPRRLIGPVSGVVGGRQEVHDGIPRAMQIQDEIIWHLSKTRWSDSALEQCRSKTAPVVAGPPLPDRPKVFAIVPGVGRQEHYATLYPNLAWLRGQDVELSCVVYVFRLEAELPLDRAAVAPCRTVYWKAHLTDYLLSPKPRLWEGADFVLLMLADVALQPGASLRRMAEVMRCNGLGMLMPSYHPQCCACTETDCTPKPSSIWNQQWESVGSKVGRVVPFTELEFNLMTPASFRCYRGLLNPDLESLGWSAVPLFPYMCPEHCQGVLDETTMYDSVVGTYDKVGVLGKVGWHLQRWSDPQPRETTWRDLRDPALHCGGREPAPPQEWPQILHVDQTRLDPVLAEAHDAKWAAEYMARG